MHEATLREQQVLAELKEATEVRGLCPLPACVASCH